MLVEEYRRPSSNAGFHTLNIGEIENQNLDPA